MLCPRCKFDSPPEMKFCGMCGTSLKTTCRSCGFANPYNFRFCGQCGVPLSSSAAEMQAADEELSIPLPGGRAEEMLTNAPPLEGERRLAAVILADVFESTNLLEQIGTETWVELMNRVLQILEAEIYRFGGQVNQFRGDGLVALFGTEVAHEDDSERAVLAALAMQKSLKTFADELFRLQRVKLSLRVGVNTGEVIVASIGERSQYSEDTAMGEAIALASRMETAAEPGTVLVSENTYRLVQPHFDWESLGEITVKGVSQPVDVYRPLSPRMDTLRSLRLKAYGISSRLVGREVQFQALRTCIENLYAGQGGVVMIKGNEGMGKSELVAEMRKWALRNRSLMAQIHSENRILEKPISPIRLQGRCHSYEQNHPYSMWIDLLYGWLGEDGHDRDGETSARLCQKTEALWRAQAAEYYPYLARFLSLPLDDEWASRIAHLDAAELRRQTLLTLRDWLDALATRDPLVIIFEDIHWADVSSLQVLEYCLPLCEQRPVLWLLLFRRDRADAMREFSQLIEHDYASRLTDLELLPLTSEQSGVMIDNLIGPHVLPEDVRALLIEKSEGNPYYIEELVQSLIRDGVLVRDEQTGRWLTARTVVSLDLPDTLRGLLLAGIDDLSPEQRHVLQIASVIGSTFWFNVLRDLVDDGVPLDRHLAALQEAQFVQKGQHVPELGLEYAFQSNMVREAAYESLLNPLRTAYHLKAAEYLEDFFGMETLPRYYDLLAYHYRSAGESSKELFYTLRAGEQARAIYANETALGHYTRALELLDEVEARATDETRRYAIRTQRFEAIDGRREVFWTVGRLDEGMADARALLPLAEQLDDDPTWLIDALLRQPGVAIWRGSTQLEEGIPMAQHALELARQIGDRQRELLCLRAIANQRLALGDPSAEQVAELARQLARQLGE